jgi:hypothetical protein
MFDALLARAEAAEGKRDSLQRRLDVEAMANEEAVQAYAALKAERDAATARAEGAERERDELQNDYFRACATVAQMHAAAMGEVCGAKRGVVEDIADLKTQCDAAIAERDAVQRVVRFAAGYISTTSGFTDKHPEDVMRWLQDEALTSAKEAGNV